MYVHADGMADVSLKQRLLEYMPDYAGNAPADADVIAVRQPVFAGAKTTPAAMD